MDLLQYGFFQHALLGSLLTAIACGIVGTYIVSRRLVFISGGITHASFGGLGLGFYLGMNPILMAMLFSVLSAFGVEWASKTQNVREDSAIAGIWSLGMALGVIFIFLTPRICTESIRLPFWKYSDCFDGRYYLDSRFGVVAGYPFLAFPAGDRLCGLR